MTAADGFAEGYVDGGDTGTVFLSGEVDIATVPSFREAVQQATAVRHQVVVVDVADVAFIDSTGLGLIAELIRHQRQHGGRVVVRGARPSVARTFTLCAMDQAVEMEPAPG